MGKRGNGEGSIYQRADRPGWYAAVSHNGRRKILRGDTRAEVDRQLTAAKAAREHGLLSTAPSQTMEAFLTQWLDQVVRPKVRPGTYRGYEQLVRVHMIPAIGRVRIDRLTPAQIQTLLNEKLAAGLSPRTVQYLRAVLRSALGQAVKWSVVPRNVAELVDGPKVERDEVVPFTPAEARLLLETARGDWLEALYTVALAMGLREGEALGLQWSDVDLEAGVINVRQQLLRQGGRLVLVPVKTKKSRRTLTAPTSIVQALRDHRQRQVAAGIAPAGFVFTTGAGTPIDARNLVRSFKALLRRAGLPDRRFHDLRHSCATLLLVQGIAPKVVQAILGHSQLAVTMDLYSHVVPELHRDAADRMDAILGSPR